MLVIEAGNAPVCLYIAMYPTVKTKIFATIKIKNAIFAVCEIFLIL